ncbi:hypothetical protein Lepto7376_2027 [[Leptolyngbya] sp. PCC 7376]|uniref:HpsJ-like protein, cyanoexosortase C-associated n=1 Tax=[Leptolyngbya] sp. PCC 7376 TaxID=111781 RepID=UPI00029EC488|nr:HpsJ family protein [[Leptolyngbya] sp. PCC 7376]AFY38329.1 hypothetical protein Lepto7376_2027 [[Leptolyngbya] sp. PCC 7376]
MTYNIDKKEQPAASGGGGGSYSAKNIAKIVGLVCTVGFIFDMLILFLPPQLGNVSWRIGMEQQFANRSVIFLFGMALLVFSSVGIAKGKGRLLLASRTALVAGVAFFLISLLAIADAIQLQNQALGNIDTRESEIQQQLRDAEKNPENLREGVNLEDLERISDELTRQAEERRNLARRQAVKTAVSNVGNLFLVGAGLVGVGRSGSRLSKNG